MAGGMLADDASVDGAFGLQHDDGSLPCCSLTDVDAFPGRAASADVWVSEVLAAADLSPTHSHFLFLGMATVTSLHPQLLPRVWGHSFSGLPGLRTGTMTRSLAWLHVVERWPRMHGSLGGMSASCQEVMADRLRQYATKSFCLPACDGALLRKFAVIGGDSGQRADKNVPGHLLAVDERHGGGGIGAGDRAADRSGCIQCPNNVRCSEKRETKLCVSLNDVCVAPEPQQTLDKIRAVGRRLR